MGRQMSKMQVSLTMAMIQAAASCGQPGLRYVHHDQYHTGVNCDGCAGLCCNQAYKYFSWRLPSSCFCFTAEKAVGTSDSAYSGGTCYSATNITDIPSTMKVAGKFLEQHLENS